MFTTKQVVDAIHAHPNRGSLPLEACLSLPIPALENGHIVLASFWYSVGGSIQNRQTSAPYCRTVADPEHLTDIRFQRVPASDLGINTPESGSLGKPTIGGRVSHDDVGQVWGDFYRVTDTIRDIYARTATTANAFPDEGERSELAAYRLAFHRIAIVALLPAYRALSPHFFAWIDAVLGPEL